MRRTLQILAMAWTTGMLLLTGCSGAGPTPVAVPEVPGFEKQADIVMPPELLDEMNAYINLGNAERINYLDNATLDQRRVFIYHWAAYGLDVIHTDLIFSTFEYDPESTEQEFEEIAKRFGGELARFWSWESLQKNSGVMRFQDISSRQEAADLADKLLRRYPGLIRHIEFNAYGTPG